MNKTDTKIVICTGGFDPIHSGHILYLQEASTLGSMLVVGLNSDEWLIRKKTHYFMPYYERFMVLHHLNMVDLVIDFNDDNGDACSFIEEMLSMYPDNELVFANGGDRTQEETPEYAAFKDNERVTFAFGVGGTNKENSSSWILEKWKSPTTTRNWGHYKVLDSKPTVKVKELIIDPYKSLSMQRHQHRSEVWLVNEGSCLIDQNDNNPPLQLTKYDHCVIEQNSWHKIINPHNVPCKITEIQYGEQCDENDIERLANYK